MRTFVATLLLLLFSIPCPAAGPAVAKPPSPGPLIDAVLAAYGGKAALTKVKGYKMEGRIQATDPRGEAPFTRLLLRPDRLAVTLAYASGPERRLLDGTQGWRSGRSGQVEKVEGFLLDSMILQAARASLPWLLDARRKEIRLMEATLAGGARIPVLELTLKQGLLLKVFIDPGTRRIGLVEGTLSGKDVFTQFRTEYSDYRTVEGILFAFHEENFASASHTGTTVVSSIALNPKTAKGDFRP